MLINVTDIMHIVFKTKEEVIQSKLRYDDHVSVVSFTNVDQLGDDAFPCLAVHAMSTCEQQQPSIHYYVLIPIDKTYAALTEF